MSPAMVTIRAAVGQAAQQVALRDWLFTLADVRCDGNDRKAVIVEGAFAVPTAPAGVIVERIGAGCVCCIGQTVLSVTLTRLLRAHHPAQLLLLLTSDQHIDRVRRMLNEDRFANVLQLSDSVHDAGSR